MLAWTTNTTSMQKRAESNTEKTCNANRKYFYFSGKFWAMKSESRTSGAIFLAVRVFCTFREWTFSLRMAQMAPVGNLHAISAMRSISFAVSEGYPVSIPERTPG